MPKDKYRFMVDVQELYYPLVVEAEAEEEAYILMEERLEEAPFPTEEEMKEAIGRKEYHGSYDYGTREVVCGFCGATEELMPDNDISEGYYFCPSGCRIPFG